MLISMEPSEITDENHSNNLEHEKIPKSAIVTVTLVTGGSLLAATGLTFLVSLWKIFPAVKLLNSVGISKKAISIGHQVGAVTFLSASAVHIKDKRKVIGKHFKQVYKGSLAKIKSNEKVPQGSYGKLEKLREIGAISQEEYESFKNTFT